MIPFGTDGKSVHFSKYLACFFRKRGPLAANVSTDIVDHKEINSVPFSLSTKHAIHLVLKSDLKGVFNPGNRRLEQLIRNTAEKFHIRVYSRL